MDIKIQIPDKEIAEARQAFAGADKEFESELKRFIIRSTYRAAGWAKQMAPVKFGRLRQSITVTTKDLTGEVAVNVEYAGAVEFGSKPHIIRPRRKKALAFKPGAGFRFWDEGGRVVVKYVKHPGTKAQPFLRPAMDKIAGKIGPGIKNILDNLKGRP